MDILLYVLLCTFFLVPGCYSELDDMKHGCYEPEFNRSTCIYKLCCVRYINYDYNYFRQDSFCDDVPTQYNGYNWATVYLTLKEQTDPSMILSDYRDLANIISMLDISSNYYSSFPNFVEMYNLKILNMSGNFLTEAKLYNVYELRVLEEIDLSHNEIADIKVERNQIVYETLKTINLSHNNLVIIEDGIFNNFFDLEHLDLSYNFIQHLTVMTFDGIRNLKYFNLKHNTLSELDGSLFRFNQLSKLDLSENKIKKIETADFDKLLNLKFLDLSSNLIIKVDENIFNRVIFLETLNLRNNLIGQIQKDMFVNNTNLENIDLSMNRISSLPKDLFKDKRILEFSITENELQGALVKGNFEGLKLVTKVDLSSQQLISIEDYAFYGLENLNTLLLNGNNLQAITKMSFKTLRSLEVLDLSDNRLTNIEFEKDDLISLRKLLLQKNLLVQIKHEFFYALNSLQYLDLSRNNISKLEINSFKSLKDLVNFQISYNPISGSLEESTFEGLNSLPRLDISGTLLYSIKNGSFKGMTELKEFNASRCKISELQYNLFLHTGLIETIDLSFNELSDFNINTTELINLNRLVLNNNLITRISSLFLSGLPNLVNVMVSHNKIETVDEKAFEDQKNIQYLDLSYNLNLRLDITQLEEIESLMNVILSGIRTNITFRSITGMTLTRLEMSESNICNATFVGLSKLKSLEYLILNKNNLTKVEALDFHGILNLKELDLSFNNIFFIQPGSFKDNILLRSLNISHNMLTAVSYGIFTGLIYLDILDISYNEINNLRSERFYQVPSLSVLIVDHNKINNIEAEDFSGTNIRKLSIGENPLPCHVLINLDKVEKKLVITAIRLDDSSNDENVHGVTCNMDTAIDKQSERENIPAEKILLDIRNILNNNSFNKIIEKSVSPVANNDFNIFIDLKDQIEKMNYNFNASNKNNTFLLEKFSSNIVESNNNNSLLTSNTNLLLGKILTTLNTLTAVRRTNVPAPIEISNDKKTAEIFITYVNKMKQDLEDTIAAEKENILKEIESRMTSIKSITDTDKKTSVATTVQPTHEAFSNKENNSNSYVFMEVCVGLILVILLAFILFKIYHSGVFVLNRHSSSTRQLSDITAL